jgi:hypothetical protein
MSRLPRILPRLLAAAAAVLLASPALAYVIVLKDGSRIVAKEKPTIEGDKLIFVTKIGVTQSLPAKDFDSRKTDEVNKIIAGGDALILNTPEGEKTLSTMDTKRPTLSEYIKRHNETNLVLKDQTQAPAIKPSGARGADRPAVEKPSAGETALDPSTNDAFLRALEASGIRGPRLTGVAHGVRVQAVTDSEQQVFAAIGGVARGLKETRAAGKPLDKAEIWLVTSNGQSAGRFEMGAEDADALLNGKVGAAKYFVANVIF